MDTDSLITTDGQIWLPPAPDPLPEPTFGWRPKADDLVVFIAHDNPPYRLADESLKFTNETMPEIQSYNADTGKVNVNDFMTIKLHLHREWLHEIERMNNRRILDLWVGKGYGWCDKDAPHTNPYTDEIKYNVIDCGGNRRRGLGIIEKNGIMYVLIEMQKISDGPNSELTYENAPHLVQKQSCVTQALTWRTPVQGDVIWPNIAPDELVAYNLSRCRLYPEIPFDALLHSRRVSVLEYCLQGSTTLVRVTGELLGWYVAEESPVPPGLVEPYASLSWRDYHKYIDCSDWPSPGDTIQNCGWAKQ